MAFSNMKNFSLGISTWFQSWGFIFRNRMVHFFLYPLIFILLWSWGASFGIGLMVDYLRDALMQYVPQVNSSGAEVGFWELIRGFFRDAAHYSISVLLWLAFSWLYYKMSKYIILIMMSPVMALISERTEELLTGKRYPFDFVVFARDILRGILMALRNFALEMIIMAAVMAFNFFVGLFAAPVMVVVSPLSAVFLFVIGAYFYGFATMDYNNERARLSVGQSAALIRKYKWLAVANGAVFSLWLFVPILGTFVGTVIAPVTCTVAATLAMHQAGLLQKREFVLDQTE